MRGKWTEFDLTRVKELSEQGMKPESIGERLGRTRKAIIAKLAWLGLTPEMKQRRYDDEARRRLGRVRLNRSDYTTPRHETPETVIEERNTRHLIRPRDLTAMFCGDPLPGYSALERRS